MARAHVSPPSDGEMPQVPEPLPAAYRLAGRNIVEFTFWFRKGFLSGIKELWLVNRDQIVAPQGLWGGH